MRTGATRAGASTPPRGREAGERLLVYGILIVFAVVAVALGQLQQPALGTGAVVDVFDQIQMVVGTAAVGQQLLLGELELQLVDLAT